MLGLAMRELWARRRRLGLTVISVALGVAFMSGTLVLRDALGVAVNDLVGQANQALDAQVRGTALFDANASPVRNLLDSSLAAAVSEVDGVAAAEGSIVVPGGATLLTDSATEVGGQGGATEVDAWITDQRLRAHALTAGRGPKANSEMTLSKRALELGGYDIGDQVNLVTPAGPSRYLLVGIHEDPDPRALSASITLAEAQQLSGASDQIESVLVRAQVDVSEVMLVEQITPMLPDTAEVVTGTQASNEQAEARLSELGFVSDLLVLFAAIALGFGSFIIYNTFSILVVQRTQQLALLRTLGASRIQALGSVLTEAAAIGTVAATLGLGLGIGLAVALQVLLNAIGIAVPGNGPVVDGGTVGLTLIVGLVVTVVSALPAAWRATRVAPIAALRAIAPSSAPTSRLRSAVALALVAAATAACSPALTRSDSDALPLVGTGVLLAVVAVVVGAPLIVRAMASAFRYPMQRLGGITATLARSNATRSPERSAATVSALTMGVALVAMMAVLGASLEASIGSDVGRGLRGELVVRNQAGGAIPQSLADQLDTTPGVRTVARLRRATVQVTLPDGTSSTERLAAVDPAALSDVVDARMVTGSLTGLTDRGIMIDQQVAGDDGLGLGDQVSVQFPTGVQRQLTVEAISDDVLFAGNWLTTLTAFSSTNPQQLDYQLPLRLDDDTTPTDVVERVEEAVAAHPTLEVLDRAEFIAANTSQIAQIVNLVYIMLALSALITIMGIANTLSLSLQERTREIGLIRAVGATRRQVRSSLRWEAALITAMGTSLGIVLGMSGSYVLIHVLQSQGFTNYVVPSVPMLVIATVFAGLGIVASAAPARRAARMNILASINTG